jgi:hypothetical protein
VVEFVQAFQQGRRPRVLRRDADAKCGDDRIGDDCLTGPGLAVADSSDAQQHGDDADQDRGDNNAENNDPSPAPIPRSTP